MLKPTTAKTPTEYIAHLDEPRKTDIHTLHELIKKTVPKLTPFMQSGMIGYGKYHYKYASGREGDWAIIALASQKNYISLYVCASDGKHYLAETYKDTLPHASIGKSCIRFKKLSDIDISVIKTLLQEGERLMQTSK